MSTERGLLAALRRTLIRFEHHREDAVVELVPPAGDLLDVGCGPGGLLGKMAGRAGLRVGVDVSAEVCEQARAALARLGGAPAGVVLASVDRGLPLANGSFDVVTLVAVLQHVLDPFACLAEVRRVLRPQGLLVLEVPNLAFLPRRVSLLAGHLPRISFAPGWDGGTLHHFTLRSLKYLLRRCGFTVERVSGSGVFAPLRRWLPSLLCGDLIAVARREA